LIVNPAVSFTRFNMNADDVVLTPRAPRARAVRTPASAGIGQGAASTGHAGLIHIGRGQLALGMHALRHTGQKAQTLLSDLSARWHPLKRPARKSLLSLQAWQAAANAHCTRPAANDPRAMFACTPSLQVVRPSSHPASRGVLRSIRWVDANGSQPVVRLRLSGRMEDVCAELDRLAALES
jgi:hypothetical protein